MKNKLEKKSCPDNRGSFLEFEFNRGPLLVLQLFQVSE